MTIKKFGWRKKDDSDNSDGLLYECTDCGRQRTKTKPGLSGGKMVARCGNCQESTLWEWVEDDDE